MFHKKQLRRTSQTEFRFEKVIERKGDRLYTKWKSYDNSNNSWNLIKEIVQDQSILFQAASEFWWELLLLLSIQKYKSQRN